MSKWKQRVDPTEVEAKQFVAEVLPALRMQRDALMASWGETIPDDATKILHREVIKPALDALFGDDNAPAS